MNKSAVRIPFFTLLWLLAGAAGAVTLNYQAVSPGGSSDRAGFTLTISERGVVIAPHDRRSSSVVSAKMDSTVLMSETGLLRISSGRICTICATTSILTLSVFSCPERWSCSPQHQGRSHCC